MTYSKYFILILFAVVSSFSFAQDLPRDLVERILGASDESFTFTVGTLPTDLPLPLSLSEEVEVAGSFTIRYDEVSTTTLYLSATDRTSVQEDLTAQLRLAGLDEVPLGDPWTWGFARSDEHMFSTYEFCRNYLLVTLSFIETAGSKTDVEMRFEKILPERGFDCGRTLEHAAMLDENMPPVPVLSPPADVETLEIDLGGTFSGYYTSVALEADLDPATLREHYAAQLERAGWVQVDSK